MTLSPVLFPPSLAATKVDSVRHMLLEQPYPTRNHSKEDKQSFSFICLWGFLFWLVGGVFFCLFVVCLFVCLNEYLLVSVMLMLL